MTNMKKMLSLFLCAVLIAAMALLTTACDGNYILGLLGYGPGASVEETTLDGTPAEAPQNKVTFTFIVVDKEGAETSFVISTDKKMVGDALLEEGLIEGEDGAYGLYVKKVNGILADYDIDKSYWALYKNGEYCMSGVDTTKIADGEHYELVYTK